MFLLTITGPRGTPVDCYSIVLQPWRRVAYSMKDLLSDKTLDATNRFSTIRQHVSEKMFQGPFLVWLSFRTLI